jgi:hypothetical protein
VSSNDAPDRTAVRSKIKAKDYQAASADLKALADTKQHADVYTHGIQPAQTGDYATALKRLTGFWGPSAILSSHCGIWRSVAIATLSLWSFSCLCFTPSVADSCPKSTDAIATDRPDVTNSSIVVPVGSLQSEHDLNISAREAVTTFDGTYSRLRLGFAPCVEVLVDLPTYFASSRSSAASGFTNLAPAVKWQISPEPGKVDLSAVFGLGLPTGTMAINGPGVQPYLQFPWSSELSGGWGISGMLTSFFHPADPISKEITQATFVVEKKVSNSTSLFVEYVGEYPSRAAPSQQLNSGAMYHLTPTQQIDLHVAVGLNNNAPDFIFGVGYSFRLDDLFASTCQHQHC